MTVEFKFPAQRTVEYNGKTYVIVMTPPLAMKFPDGHWHPAYLYISTTDGRGYVREQQDMEAKFELANRP